MTTGFAGSTHAISAIIFFTIAWPNELWFSATMTNEPGAADHVAAVIFVEPAGRIGVLGIPRQRRVAQDHQPVDGDALARAPRRAPRRCRGRNCWCRRPTRRWCGAAPRTARARAARMENSMPGADRGAVGERARQFEHLVADLARRGRVADDGPVDHQLLRGRARPFDEADRDARRAARTGSPRSRAGWTAPPRSPRAAAGTCACRRCARRRRRAPAADRPARLRAPQCPMPAWRRTSRPIG